MQGQTIVLFVLLLFFACILAAYQYLFKSKISRLNILFFLLRFISYACVLTLILNPKFDKVSYYNEKPNLIVAADNSASIKYLNQSENAESFLNTIKQNQELNNAFNIDYFTFDDDLKKSDSVNFNGKRTNLSNVFTSLNLVYRNTNSAILLLTDGNQTFGYDYEFSANRLNQPIYPVILGDSIQYKDVKIEQINVNRYAFLKNKFPIEIILNYVGNGEATTKLVVSSGNRQVFSKNISFSSEQTSQIIQFNLLANSPGLKTYKAIIEPVESEKNKINNEKIFGVEVIDQKSKIAIISDIVHPDIGALKKSIESNEQRQISILKPTEAIGALSDYQSVILYQPTNAFKVVFDEIKKQNKNSFIITGTNTDWTFLNSSALGFTKKVTDLHEEYRPSLNENFNKFLINDIDFSSLPPLKSYFENVDLSKQSDIILFKSVNGITTKQPLLMISEDDILRRVVLFGEGIWRWRSQSFLNQQSFVEFDTFISKLIFYLSSDTTKQRLSLDFDSFYYSNDEIKVFAQYFNTNYELDFSKELTIEVTDKKDNKTVVFPLLVNNNQYQVNLSTLAPSDYSFIVKVKNENINKSGSFSILEFNVEQQFMNANVSKLNRLSNSTNGSSFFIEDSNELINELLTDNRYSTVQKSNKNTVPLIDFKVLLILLALSLSAEWFLRKFNGLI